MPNRILRDGFVDSEPVAALSDWSHRVYSNLLVKSDDAGRFDGRLAILRSHLFPLGTTRRSEDFSRAIDEMKFPEGEGGEKLSPLIICYEFAGKPYIQITKWRRCGDAKTSRYPWTDGNHDISYILQRTRDGDKDFVLTSLLDPMPIPSAPHRNRVRSELDTETYTDTETDTQSKTKIPSRENSRAGPEDPLPMMPNRKKKTRIRPKAISGDETSADATEVGEGGVFPPGVWKRASAGWATAYKHVHGVDPVMDGRDWRCLSDVLSACNSDLDEFAKVVRAWLKEPSVGRATGHRLPMLLENINDIRSKIANGKVGENGHRKLTPSQGIVEGLTL